jgi:DNA-binding transcriptional regulator YiaG
MEQERIDRYLRYGMSMSTIEAVGRLPVAERKTMVRITFDATSGEKAARAAIQNAFPDLQIDLATLYEIQTICYDELNDAERREDYHEVTRSINAARSAAAEFIDHNTTKKLTSMRLSAGLTQKQLAERSGINIRQVQKAESNPSYLRNMAAHNLLSLADALGVDPHELV